MDDQPPSTSWEILPLYLYLTALHSSYTALSAYTPSLRSRLLHQTYPSAPYTDLSPFSARQHAALNLLLTITRLHAAMAPHDASAYDAALWGAVVVVAHFVTERGAGSVRGSGLGWAEGVAWVLGGWMLVQRWAYTRGDLGY
ncbi:hypothetical protein WHR41_05668 [Cladosporium halotolerans]|uniref:Uncharacterized protein n=1 Tax=Cladosporium halotolerans TaxID=1052096 RepID=A0AB34KN69_9PEZI